MKKNRCINGIAMHSQRWKIFLIMKLQMVFILGFLLQSVAGVSQIQSKRFDFQFENKTLKEVIQTLEDQTDFSFVYKDELINSGKRVSATFKDKLVTEVIEEVIKDENLTYSIVGRAIVIMPKDGSLSVGQQKIKLSGKITDASGQPLPGVTVVVKGTTNGTITNFDGVYTLSDVPSDGAIQFSFVGMKMQEIAVAGKTSIDITMVEDAIGIEEVVAVGYGTQSRREITGSISSVKAEDIEGQPVPNLNSALQGRIAGVQIQQNSGMPGSGVNIRVRGLATLGGSDPLYIVDGVPIESGNFSGLTGAGNSYSEDTGPSALSDLNSEDIESIQVLKDASATSIYGSRATNGVIIITTKRGKKGKATINVNVNAGISWATHKYELCNTEEYIQVIKNSYTTTGVEGSNGTIDNSNINFSTDVDVDWQNEILRDAAISKTANLSIQGGTEKINYSVSAGYLNQDGIIVGSSYERFSGRFNMEYNSSEKLKFGSNISFTSSMSNPVDNRGTGDGIVYRTIAWTAPTMKLYDEDGGYWNKTRNIVQYAKEIIFEQASNRVIGNVYMDFELIKGLSFRPSVAVDGIFMDEFMFFPNTLNNGAFKRQARSVFTHNVKWINENLLRYKKEFGGNRLEILAGYSLEGRKFKRTWLQSQGGASDAIITSNGSSEVKSYGSFITESAITSLFSRINYSFKNKYLFSASFRRDGSSRFGKEKRYGYFPSVSVGWRVSEESVLSGVEAISDLKLRASWGVTGNQNIGDYQSQGIYSGGYNYDGVSGIAPASNGFPNTELTWETTTQYNLGVDLSLLEGKISLYTDVYKKITDDILFNRTLPNTSGYTSMAANMGSMENSGFELSVTSYNINKTNFNWETNFNFSTNKNVITSLPDGEDVILGGSYYYAILREGESVGAITTFISDGLYKSQEEIVNAPKNTIYGSPLTLGDIKYVDTNDDSKITSADRKIVGQMLPKFTGGLRNVVSYKNLTLDFMFQFSYGNKVYNVLRNDINYKHAYNFDKERLNAYHPTLNPDSDIPRVKQSNYRQNSHIFFLPTDIFLEDASYIRLKTITLSYDLSKVMRNKFIKNMNVYTTGQNLFTITKYKGFDPESNNDLRQSLPGADRGAYPVPATLIFGVNVKF